LLFVSAPPDRLRRGIKAAKKEGFGTNHACQSTKTSLIPPSAIKRGRVYALYMGIAAATLAE
jgi:uncharacterized protein (DUF1501 family)